jgi:hypothetical protein
LQRFFGGSPQIWRARSRNKNNSVRRIAQHPSCPLSKSSLSEAIGVYVVVQELPFVRTSGHIGASHVAAVLRMELEEQRMWLERAELARWSVRELRAEIQSHRVQETVNGGRPRLHPSVILLRRAVRAFDRAVHATLKSRDLLQLADVDKIGELSREVLVLSARLDDLDIDAAQPVRSVATLRSESSPAMARVRAGVAVYDLSQN